jgi:hypothetical protein
MTTKASNDQAKARVAEGYRELYRPLMELVDALQDLEPGGTLIDDAVVMRDKQEVRIAYVARPVMLTIRDEDKTFILRVVESTKSQVRWVG